MSSASAGRERPKLLGLATALPDHVFSQDLIIQQVRAVFGERRDDFPRIESIFRNAGIKTRYSVVPIDWFLQPQDWPARARAYLDGAMTLYRKATELALANAGVAAGEVDTVITVSTTGISTPSLEARLLPLLGFRESVRRVPLFGLGCAGGAAGLALAGRLAMADPGDTVLLVAVELCTLAFRLDDESTKSIVATALFGDGAAAAVVSCKGRGMMELEHQAEHTWPNTLELMGWSVDPMGFGVVLSAAVPAFAERELRPVADAFLNEKGLAWSEVSHFTLHPGGAKVAAALEAAFGLGCGALARERAVLSAYGNMSSPTVLFVLRQALDDHVEGRGLLAALGPGFSATLLTYQA